MRTIRTFIAAFSAAAFAASLCGIAAASSMTSGGADRYGGPAYTGSPNLALAAAFVRAGGGAAHFDIQTALNSMAGSALVNAEVGNLEKIYGKPAVMQWIRTWNYAVPDAVHTATAAGVTIPAPANIQGKALASALVKAGLSGDGTFWTGPMLDRTISNRIHDKTMDDIDAKYGAAADAEYHKITNRAMYDLAHALGATNVKLAAFH